MCSSSHALNWPFFVMGKRTKTWSVWKTVGLPLDSNQWAEWAFQTEPILPELVPQLAVHLRPFFLIPANFIYQLENYFLPAMVLALKLVQSLFRKVGILNPTIGSTNGCSLWAQIRHVQCYPCSMLASWSRFTAYNSNIFHVHFLKKGK